MRRARSPVAPKITSVSLIAAIPYTSVIECVGALSVHPGTKHQARADSTFDQLEPGVFVDEPHAQFRGFRKLRSCARPGHHKVSLLRYGTCDFRAQSFG